MTKQKMPNSPATMRDVFNGTEAALGFTGIVVARAFPLFVRYPITDSESVDVLLAELEKLADEFEESSPYARIVMDTLIATVDDERARILASVSKAE